MEVNLKMKRYLFIPAMIPVMLILFGMVLSADRLHKWKYAYEAPKPTQADQSYAFFAFMTALLTSLVIGSIAAIVAHQKKYRPYWPVVETAIIALIFAGFITGIIFSKFFMQFEYLAVAGIVGASCIFGGLVVVTLMNLPACARQQHWGKFINSALILSGSMLYLIWLYGFIIYIDT